MKRSELVNWYLKEIESEIDSEEELINKKRIIEKVVHRLTHYVCIPCLGSRVRDGGVPISAGCIVGFLMNLYILNLWGFVVKEN